MSWTLSEYPSESSPTLGMWRFRIFKDEVELTLIMCVHIHTCVHVHAHARTHIVPVSYNYQLESLELSERKALIEELSRSD